MKGRFLFSGKKISPDATSTTLSVPKGIRALLYHPRFSNYFALFGLTAGLSVSFMHSYFRKSK